MGFLWGQGVHLYLWWTNPLTIRGMNHQVKKTGWNGIWNDGWLLGGSCFLILIGGCQWLTSESHCWGSIDLDVHLDDDRLRRMIACAWWSLSWRKECAQWTTDDCGFSRTGSRLSPRCGKSSLMFIGVLAIWGLLRGSNELGANEVSDRCKWSKLIDTPRSSLYKIPNR